MQKVITIISNIHPGSNKSDKTVTYPELDKLLEDDYVITNSIHSVSETSARFAVTFILTK